MIINKVGKKTVVRYYSGILLSKKKKRKTHKVLQQNAIEWMPDSKENRSYDAI